MQAAIFNEVLEELYEGKYIGWAVINGLTK
jgi:hypothetical protein